MEFVTLTEKEFKDFQSKHELANFFQTVETGKLRETYGAKVHYLGIKEKNKIIAGGMFTDTKSMFGMRRYYAPQGFLIDFNNKELVKFYTDNLKKYAKEHKCMFIRLDPNVIYRLRDVNGDLYPDDKPNDEVIDYLKSLGYKHFGFTKDYRFTLSRWNYRVKIDKPYEELKQTFSKSTRKNIDSTYRNGVSIRIGTKDDVHTLTELLKATADRKHFLSRDEEYYNRMYDCCGDLIRIYIAHIDFKEYLRVNKEDLEAEQKNNDEIKEKMTHDMVGNKLTNKLETSNKLIDKYKAQIKEAEDYLKEYPDGKDIGALLSVKSGKEYITLVSGILGDFKKFTPKYAMYNQHILDAYKFNMEYVNFFGISGDFSKDNPVYGVYEFKKGFNGEVVEMVGEFTLPVSSKYYLYNMFRHLKIVYRNIKGE